MVRRFFGHGPLFFGHGPSFDHIPKFGPVMVRRLTLVMVRRFLVMVRRLTIFRNLVRHFWFGDQPSNVAFWSWSVV